MKQKKATRNTKPYLIAYLIGTFIMLTVAFATFHFDSSPSNYSHFNFVYYTY